MKPTTLVVGAGGFLGTHISRALGVSGHAVVGMDPHRPKGIAFERFVSQPSNDRGALKDALSGCDNVVYLGGYSRPGSEIVRISEELSRETGHVLDLAETCREAGIARFVAVSSGGTVYGEPVNSPMTEDHPTKPISVYGYTRLAMEHGLRLVANSGNMSATVMRLANPYGPGQMVRQGQGLIPAVVSAFHSRRPFEIWGDGSAVRDFVYVSDVARAFVLAVEAADCPDVINIGSGQGHSVLDVCSAVENVVGKKLELVFHPARSVDVASAVLSIERARETLEWEPTVPLEQGIGEFLSWYDAILKAESDSNES